MNKIENKSNCECKGVHIIQLYDARTYKAQKFSNLLEDVRRERVFLKSINQLTEEREHNLWERFQYYKKILQRYFLQKEYVCENITTTVGRSAIAHRLRGGSTYTGQINYTALGDNNTAEVIGDATLGNETSRKALSTGANTNNQAIVETFFLMSEAVDTHEEFGMFIDGTGAADSGQLFNRWTQTITKTNVQTMNVQSIININDA